MRILLIIKYKYHNYTYTTSVLEYDAEADSRYCNVRDISHVIVAASTQELLKYNSRGKVSTGGGWGAKMKFEIKW